MGDEVTDEAEALTDADGRAGFTLSAQDLAPSVDGNPATGTDSIVIKFTLLSDDGNPLLTTYDTWNVRNNSNTVFGDVLSGEAVFVHDGILTDSHAGVTPDTVTGDGERMFDFVQELLNQVVPRKRSVGNHQLIDEDGLFFDEAMNAAAVFKREFNLNVNTSLGDTSDTFDKLMRDYGREAEAETWLNRVMGREFFVGETRRDSDDMINGTTGDTGLYELYDNTVRVFVDAMTEEAERYAGLRGAVRPTDNWVARTGQGPAGSANPHGPGMSYCFGCTDSVEHFNDTVANCQAETTTQITNREGDPNQVNYRGNINNQDCNNVGTGDRDWAGLRNRNEQKLWRNSVSGSAPFNPSYWAGIDCSSLVQRVVESGRNAVPGLVINIPSLPTLVWSGNFFINDHASYRPNPDSLQERVVVQKKLRKGDLVRYPGHISIVYSERPSVSNDTCIYQVIHAYGVNSYRYPDIDEAGVNANEQVFSRKVLVTFQNISTRTGFGRIKLWD